MKLNKDSVTLYLANNQTIARIGIRDELIRVFEAALSATDHQQIFSAFINFIVDNCISRICRKIDKVLELRPSPTDPQFTSFGVSITVALNTWLKMPMEEASRDADSRSYGKRRRDESANVVPLVQQLINWLETERPPLKLSSTSNKRVAMERLWEILRVLLPSEFISEQRGEGDQFGRFISMTGRRLRQVYRYYHGISIFIKVWLPELRKLATPVPNILWIQEVSDREMPTEFHNVDFNQLDGDPSPFIESLVRAKFDHYDDDTAHVLIETLHQTRKKLSEPWPKGGKIRLRLHCEIQLVTFHIEQDIDIYRGAIGGSKLCCQACDIWLQVLKESRPDLGLDWTGTSSRAYGGWAVPNHNATTVFLQRLHVAMDEALERMTDPDYLEHNLSFGTDSSNGPELPLNKEREEEVEEDTHNILAGLHR
ncbi:hypothetical protein CERSUDRAFT_116161 [Gelatoporia subvermispora B]|uniref:Uncharacterized protein n=1 Tax=Ceriporiopsis subvermispora (strain B) TaxID=914234 RepID=M2PH66_CERS8|nr:hypothetical protein CERSUDRAFT_116161 [Gelatoporia subvermispora B]